MLAWIPLAIGAVNAALGAYSAYKGSRKPKKAAPDPRMASFDAAVGRAGERGEAADNEYYNRISTFDPMAAALQANQAQYNMAMPQIRRQVADLRGSQVATGRLRTGYGHGDQDELIEGNLQHLNQGMIARAMEAANMTMANNQAIGSYADRNQNLYMDATYGRYMTEEDRRRAEEASRRGMWGSLAGAAIGSAGQIAGAYAGRSR